MSEAYAWLGAAALLAGLVAGRREEAPPRRGLDLALVLGLLALGLPAAWGLSRLANPGRLYHGQDAHEYLAYTLSFLYPVAGHRSGFRYPLFPWLSAELAEARGLSAFEGTVEVGLFAAGVLPAAIYLLGRQVAPPGLALAAALISPLTPLVLGQVDAPSEYLFCAVLRVLFLAAAAAAARRGGVLRLGAFGLAAALTLSSTPKALVDLCVGLPVVALAGLLHPALAPGPAWRRLLAAVAGLVAWGAPLAVAWELHRPIGRDLVSLEAALEKVRLEEARRPVPQSVYRAGHWRIGDPEALRHLPDTVRSLAGAVGGGGGGQGSKDPLAWLAGRLALPAPLGGLALLGPLGALWVEGRARWGSALAAALLAAAGLAQVAGLLRAPLSDRYALALGVTLPLAVLAGAAVLPALVGRGRVQSATWWALPVVASLILAQAGPLSWAWAQAQARAGHLFVDSNAIPPFARVFGVFQAGLRPGDRVVDATERHLAVALLAPRFSTHVGSQVQERLVVSSGGPPTEGGRRFVVGQCAFGFGPSTSDRAAFERWAAERFTRVEACLWEDPKPGETWTWREP